MKKLWFGLLATLLLTIFVVPAFAWEFNMTGQFEWRFRYFGRAGGYADLFGDRRFQDSPLNNTGVLTGFAGPNYYRGLQWPGGLQHRWHSKLQPYDDTIEIRGH